MADVDELQKAVGNRVSNSLDWIADNCPCAACQWSSPDRCGPRVLTALKPYTDESLVGLVARISARNWLPRLRSILSATTSTWHVHYNLARREDIDFAQLAFACRLPPHEIENRRYVRVDLTQDLPGVNFHGAKIPLYDLELRSRRICPSWAKAGYHSAFAHHGLVTHCPASGEILLDTCPRCRAKLKWTKTTFHLCNSCGLNLAHHQGELVRPSIRKATQLILGVVHSHPKRHASAVAKIHPSLAALDRGTIFELGWRIGCVLTGQGLGDRDLALKLPFDTRLSILAAGSEALESWPHSISEAVERSGRSEFTGASNRARDFGQILAAKNAWPALKVALQRAAPRLSAGTLTSLKSSLIDGANSGELAQALGVSQKVIERLRGTADLIPVHSSGDINSHQLFEASALGDLKARLNDRISVAAISERLDVSHHGLEQLACLKHLQIYDDGALRSGFVRRQAKRSDFECLLSRLTRAAQNSGPHDRADPKLKEHLDPDLSVTMHVAMKVIGGREKPWGPVILAMLSGDLPFHLDQSHNGRFMSRVSLAKANLEKLAAMRFEETGFPTFNFEPFINGRDTEELLNIHPKVLQAAKSDKTIPTPVDGLYDRQAMRSLAARYISSAEMRVRFPGKSRTIPAPLKGRNPLIRASALGWSRQEAEPAVRNRDLCVV